jgi:hypothetical protein
MRWSSQQSKWKWKGNGDDNDGRWAACHDWTPNLLSFSPRHPVSNNDTKNSTFDLVFLLFVFLGLIALLQIKEEKKVCDVIYFMSVWRGCGCGCERQVTWQWQCSPKQLPSPVHIWILLNWFIKGFEFLESCSNLPVKVKSHRKSISIKIWIMKWFLDKKLLKHRGHIKKRQSKSTEGDSEDCCGGHWEEVEGEGCCESPQS